MSVSGDHVRGVSVTLGLVFGLQAPVILPHRGAAPARLHDAVGDMSGSTEGTLMMLLLLLLLRPVHVGVVEVMGVVRVMALIGAKARIEVGVVIFVTWPLLLVAVSCRRAQHRNRTVPGIIPVHHSVFTDLTWMRGNLLFEMFSFRIFSVRPGVVCGSRVRLKGSRRRPGALVLLFPGRNLGFLSQFISQRPVRLVCPLRMVELTLDTIGALFV